MTQGFGSTLPSYFLKFIYLFQLEDNYNIVVVFAIRWKLGNFKTANLRLTILNMPMGFPGVLKN